MIVVAGVTGNTGSVVAESLLAQGKKVRVIVRDEAKGKAWRDKGAEVAVATLDDAPALTKALEGASGVYLLSPPDMGSSDFLTARRKTFEAVAVAVDAARVPHVVLLSSVGAQHAEGTGIIRTVHAAEQRLAKTGAKLTLLRAAYFLENWATVAGATRGGKLPTFLAPERAIPMVATRDIGLAAARALVEGPPAEKIQVIELAGPRDLSPNDVAAAFAKVLGREVTAEYAPPEAIVPAFTSFGISEHVSELFEQMYRGLAAGTVDWEGKGARFVRGSTDVETVAKALIA